MPRFLIFRQCFWLPALAVGLGVLLLLAGCATSSQSSTPSTVTAGGLPVPPAGQAILQVRPAFDERYVLVPPRVYVFPPLWCDHAGQPIGALKPVTLADGSLTWQSPDRDELGVQALVEEAFRGRNFQVVPFHEVLEPGRPHGVLLVNIFLTAEPFGLKEDGGFRTVSFSTLVRLAGVTFDDELNLGSRRDIFDVQVLALYRQSREIGRASALAALQAVGMVGQRAPSAVLVDL